MQQEITDILYQFGILWKCLAIMGGLIGTTFTATFAYIRSSRSGIEKLNTATFDQLAVDNAKISTSVNDLYERVRKNENRITELFGEVKRIDEKCKIIQNQKWDGHTERRKN